MTFLFWFSADGEAGVGRLSATHRAIKGTRRCTSRRPTSATRLTTWSSCAVFLVATQSRPIFRRSPGPDVLPMEWNYALHFVSVRARVSCAIRTHRVRRGGGGSFSSAADWDRVAQAVCGHLNLFRHRSGARFSRLANPRRRESFGIGVFQCMRKCVVARMLGFGLRLWRTAGDRLAATSVETVSCTVGIL